MITPSKMCEARGSSGVYIVHCVVKFIVEEPESGVPSLSVAVTVSVCGPTVSLLVSSEYVKPTLGQPGRPGPSLNATGGLVGQLQVGYHNDLI